MKIETKFDVGDFVCFIYFQSDNLPFIRKCRVENIKASPNRVTYDVLSNSVYYSVEEEHLFHTPNEAIEYIYSKMKERIVR